MFTAFDVTALTKALVEVEGFITALVEEDTGLKPAGKLQWTAVNPQQMELVRRFEAVSADLPHLPELQAWARETAEHLNEILEEHGFSIRLVPWAKSPNRFGVVAIYDISIEWLQEGAVANKEGVPYTIPSNGRPAFRLDMLANRLRFYRVKGRTIVKIPGQKAGDWLCLTSTDRPLEQFHLLREVESLRRAMVPETSIYDFGGAVLPNVIFDTGTGLNIEWLIGLYLTDAAGDDWTIIQARMQAKFAFGRKGARAKVGVGVGVTRIGGSLPMPDYVVDHDVIFWMERDGVPSEPFFVAYVERREFADHQVELSELK